MASEGKESQMEMQEMPDMRDVEKARVAFNKRDVAASRAAHMSTGEGKLLQAHEDHKKAGEWVKSVVYGGLDGIITTFAVVAGASGGGLGIDVIIILGFSNIFADGLSMGMGDALSSKAERDYILAERQREAWEMKTYPEGEKQEMVQIYKEKGFTDEDAKTVIDIMAKYNEFFVDLMMVQELNLQVPDPDDNPWKDGFVTFISFILFGLIPLIGYVIFSSAGMNDFQLFIVAIVLTAITLFFLGAVKSHVTNQKWYWSGLEILVLGALTAATAFFIGWGVEELIVSSSGAVAC